MKNISFKTKLFLKFPNSIKVFFKSTIGPTTKNPITELRENDPKKPLAMNASEVEHTERRNDNKIIIISDVLLSFGIYRLLFIDIML